MKFLSLVWFILILTTNLQGSRWALSKYVPYIWILSLCAAYPDNTLFQELQLLDYRDFFCIENPTIPGNTSRDSFEKLMVQIRKIRSCTFSEGERVTIGDLHHGGFMTKATGKIAFVNHELTVDVAANQVDTKTDPLNKDSWPIKTKCSEVIDLRENKVILRNADNAPAGDAVLCLDALPPCTEVQQYKNIKNGNHCDFDKEHGKAAGNHDIFVLISTAPIPSLKHGDDYKIPSRCILVTPENWQSYFGLYAARSYLFAKRAQDDHKLHR
jgi:hypothetical protein